MATYLELKGDTFISRDAEEWRTEQMTKTLGQLAYRAFNQAFDESDGRMFLEAWEAAAQAVRAAVIEECAKAAEDEHVGTSVEVGGCTNDEDAAYNLALRHAADAIRALKDKQ